MKLQEVTLYENRSHRILQEGWQDLTEEQQIYQLLWEKELWPLLEQYKKLAEAELTAKQISSIFQSAEEVADASGNNKNLLGKAASAAMLPVDIAKKVNAKIDELGRMAQNTGPVKNMDAKFEKLKADIKKNNSDSKIVKGVEKISNWAKENPGKASIAVAILTTIAAFAGGPAGGAAAGLILRASKDLLQGEKLSTSVGKAVKTAAIGALVGAVADQVGDFFQGVRGEVIDQGTFARVDYGATQTIKSPGYEWSETIQGVNIKVLPDDAEYVNDLMDLIGQGGDTANKAFDELADFAKEIRTDDYIDALKDAGTEARNNDSLFQFITAAKNGISALAQGAAQASDDKKNKEESIDLHQEYNKYLQEAGIIDKIKKTGKSITAGKLERMWKKAGKPTDSGSILNILQAAGLQDDAIAQVQKQSQVKLPKKAAGEQIDLKKLAAAIQKANISDQVKQQLQKSLTVNKDFDKSQKLSDYGQVGK